MDEEANGLNAIAKAPDRAEFIAEAQKNLTAVIERGDIKAVRWMIQTAADYHANQATLADSFGEPDLSGCVKHHEAREKELLALLSSSKAPTEKWAVFCGICKKEWTVEQPHSGKSLCGDCERRFAPSATGDSK